MPHPLITSALILLATTTSFAQVVTVQQPVVSTFTGGTTVMVPDRGRMHLGSVNSAASGRITTGPFRSGSSIGLERTASSMSVGVFIHDLAAMDQALLNQGRNPAANDVAPYAARLAARRGQSVESAGQAAIPPERPDSAGQAARFEQLARDAEARGKASLARLHWQMAAKHGSAAATAQLTKPR
jgi:hypothetical protein